MTRKNLLSIAAAGIVLILAVTIAVYFRSRNIPVAKVQDMPQRQIVNVELKDGKAQPDAISINQGDSVQFNSRDSNTHVIAEGKGNADGEQHEHNVAGLHSPEFKGLDGYKIDFSKAGTFYFHDHFNPNAYISVTVKPVEGFVEPTPTEPIVQEDGDETIHHENPNDTDGHHHDE